MSKLQIRILILTGILAVGFSSVWCLPKAESMKPSRLARHLPLEFETYRGKRVTVTGREREILAADTEFERVSYVDSSDSSIPGFEVSVVFSGKDLNNSIHRPEVCLQAQGWNFEKETDVVVPGALRDGGDMTFREIVCRKTVFDPETKKPVILPNGEQLYARRVQYYTFLGHTDITPGHYDRTMIDMKDRLFKGYDQRWAYVTFSMVVTGAYAEQGAMQGKSYNLEETEKLLATFIKKLAPLVVDVPEDAGDNS
ncbi:hypothetical protein NT6N_17830 [Oceaniferula spumae]|uniref:Methanolan biosynthesis EpsI domain-containing protein n=1 Tax=Oceaniferula spumae TaxID=2979115 RepID=A0AAT9FLB6_9BACT